MSNKGNGKNLSIMTEDEFVGADPITTQRWTYRMLCSICSDIKIVKKDLKAEKEKRRLVSKAYSFAGGVVGGIAAWLGMLFTGVKSQ